MGSQIFVNAIAAPRSGMYSFLRAWTHRDDLGRDCEDRRVDGDAAPHDSLLIHTLDTEPYQAHVRVVRPSTPRDCNGSSRASAVSILVLQPM